MGIAKRRLGNTGLHVSEVAFGCVEIGMPYGIGVHSRHDMLSEDEAVELLQTALQSGINFFDTARAYGNSENLIGQAFAQERHKVVIATKCAHFTNANGIVPPYAELKQVIETSLQESLAALKTDYIDVYMLHQASKAILQSEAVAEIFNELKHAGRIKATGVSTYTNAETQLAIDTAAWDVIQVPFNLMDQRQAQLFDLAQAKGIGLVIRSVLLKGLLSDRGQNLHPALASVEKHIHQYQTLTQATGLTLPALATQFALAYPQVSSILVGIDKLSYLEQSITAAQSEHLNAAMFKQVQSMAYPDPEFLDLPKWDREGWLT